MAAEVKVSVETPSMDELDEVMDEMMDEGTERERRLVVDAAGKFMLAAIGAVGLAQDALEDLLNRMIERGEITQHDARKMMNELNARRRHPLRRRMSAKMAVEDPLDAPPTKADIESLHAQIATLSAKLDALQNAPVATVKVETASPTPKPPTKSG